MRRVAYQKSNVTKSIQLYSIVQIIQTKAMHLFVSNCFRATYNHSRVVQHSQSSSKVVSMRKCEQWVCATLQTNTLRWKPRDSRDWHGSLKASTEGNHQTRNGVEEAFHIKKHFYIFVANIFGDRKMYTFVVIVFVNTTPCELALANLTKGSQLLDTYVYVKQGPTWRIQQGGGAI